MQDALAPDRDLVHRVALLWHVIYATIDQQRKRTPSVHVVRHEDLSLDPVGEYGKLYEALGLPFADETAATVRASSSGANPKETRVEKPHETRIDSRANLENWRQRLSRDDLVRIRRLTEETAGLFYSTLEWT
jgi:hypothetical protein